jgi:hypothetical protein
MTPSLSCYPYQLRVRAAIEVIGDNTDTGVAVEGPESDRDATLTESGERMLLMTL